MFAIQRVCKLVVFFPFHSVSFSFSYSPLYSHKLLLSFGTEFICLSLVISVYHMNREMEIEGLHMGLEFSFHFFSFLSLLFWFVVFFGGCKHHTLYVQRIDTLYECLLSLLFCCMLYNFDVFQVDLLWVHCIVYTDVRFAQGLIIGKSTICSFPNYVRIQSIICGRINNSL